ncbi:ABC transporter permease [Lewinella sp. LCG006]|uniref:ABC transporter permease n=1 Tax=Lewinella sp. LCG006 TaxID=3231911 RepID=UPI00345F1930
MSRAKTNTIGHFTSYWYLAKQLIRVSLTVEFKKSFIGLFWLFLSPILAVIIWIFLHSAGVVTPGETVIPYPAYVLLSTSIWGFFIELYRQVSLLLSTNNQVLVSVSFPIEALIIERIAVHLIRFVIPLIINIIVLVLFGIKLHWISFLFPLALLPLLCLGLSLGLITAIFRIVMVDIARLMDQGLGLLMYFTPVIYSPDIPISWLQDLVLLNPLTYLVGVPRDLLTQGTYSNLPAFAAGSVFSFLLLLLTFTLFKKTQKKVLERFINN